MIIGIIFVLGYFTVCVLMARSDGRAEAARKAAKTAPPPPPPAPPTAQEVADATLNSAARSLLIASVANAVVNKGRK
jgi:hypothetical protein